MEMDILTLQLSSVRGTHSTAFQPAPEQTRGECLAEKAGAVAGPNGEHTGMVGSPGLRQGGLSTACISNPGAPSPDHGRTTQPSQPFFLLSPDMDLEFFSKAVL